MNSERHYMVVRTVAKCSDGHYILPQFSLHSLFIFYSVRRDRNRHGGGMLMYIREVIQVETNASNQYPNLEIATVTLRFGSFKSCLSL